MPSGSRSAWFSIARAGARNVTGARASSGVGQHPGGHRRVEQAEVDEVGVDRVEPLAGLGQQLERRAEAVRRRVVVAGRPGPAPARTSRVRLSWSRPSAWPIAIVRSRSHQQRRPEREEVGTTAPRRLVAVGPGRSLGGEPRQDLDDQRGAGRSPPRQDGRRRPRPGSGSPRGAGRPGPPATRRTSRGPGGDGAVDASIRGSVAGRRSRAGCQRAETAAPGRQGRRASE